MLYMNILENLNIKKNCEKFRVGLLECPQFLFLLMGIIIVAEILITYILTQHFEEPEIAALVIIVISGALFVIGNIIVKAFERVAIASRAKSEFIGIMSHELRSPLSAIKWQIDVLLADKTTAPTDPISTLRYLETIDQQNERMIRVVNDLLEVNRIEDSNMVLRPLFFSIDNLVKKVVAEYTQYASSNNIVISTKLQCGDAPVYADEERVKMVIEHLLDNAIRYSVHGGTVSVETLLREDEIYFQITDSGIGIIQEERKRIFEKFFRSPKIMRYQTGGAGVGLFISKSIINMLNGDIGFDSKFDEGSKFWFTLPRGK